ncbi:MAG: 1,4-dihydroxy-2-naphthoate polyprenyltransferase [marine benthic group bacterium]|nr:1,4-dihydroxy-2-naphthoate polyprenyltransferase [Gemmatimonadota bacterium]
MTAPAPGALETWVLAARPKTLPAALAPVLVGTAVAWSVGGFRAGPAVAAALGALLLQVGANLANDVYDFERGADQEDRTGPLRVTQAGLLTPEQVRRGMAAVFGASMVVGIYLTAIAGWQVIAIGLAAIGAAIAYTGGPWPLGYNGLGELFVLIFFGFVAVCGTAFVQAGAVPHSAWPAGFAAGCLASAILVVNNVRDIEQDRQAGKRTLQVRFGRAWGVGEYVALVALGFLVPVATVLAANQPPTVLLVLAAAPLAIPLFRSLRNERGPVLNRTLAGTARLFLVWSLLFSAGIMMGGRG